MKNLLIMSLFLAVTSLALSAQAYERYQCVDTETGKVLHPGYEYHPTNSEEENIKSMDTIMRNCLSLRSTRFEVKRGGLFRDIDDNGQVVTRPYDRAKCIQTRVTGADGDYLLPTTEVVEELLFSRIVENVQDGLERSREISKLLWDCLTEVGLDIQ